MKKLIIFLLTLTAIYFIFLLCACNITINKNIDKPKVDTVFVVKVDSANFKGLEKKNKKLKKTLRFRTYQRDSLQCKLDSFIYSIIKKQ